MAVARKLLIASTLSVPYIPLTWARMYAALERNLPMPNHPIAYETDFYAWTQEQARLLDARQFDALDVPNLVEEITSLGKSEQRELYHRLSSLLAHLLKLALAAQHSPLDLQRAGRGWRATVKTQRLGVAKSPACGPPPPWSWRAPMLTPRQHGPDHQLRR